MFKFVARPCPLPEGALLRAYEINNGFVDCFYIEVPKAITYAQFVEAFYTSWLFKMERFILKWVVAKPSTDEEARQLAHNAREQYAAWTVEGRAENQLLMCDYQGATRSWFMVEPQQSDCEIATLLFFGSAISPARSAKAQARRNTVLFRAMVGLHTLYSKALLDAAYRKLPK
jgi:hypothetical protein